MELLQAFYKQKPTVDTPYRTLVVDRHASWQVRLTGGTKWGAEDRQVLEVVPAQSFDEARELYDKMYGDLEDEGWKAYSPHETWE